jgi:broad specificity phosphatase PhoE
MKKEVYLIRHAQSEANASLDHDDQTVYYDPNITNLGKKQAAITRKLLANIDFDLIVCSPLRRALQTFEYIFPEPIQNTVVLPLVREYLNDSADVGSQPNVLRKEFANFDFSGLRKFWWNNDVPIDEKEINYESIQNLDARVKKFKKWIEGRDEGKIAVISHGTFISRITYYFPNNCEFQIWNPDHS